MPPMQPKRGFRGLAVAKLLPLTAQIQSGRGTKDELRHGIGILTGSVHGLSDSAATEATQFVEGRLSSWFQGGCKMKDVALIASDQL